MPKSVAKTAPALIAAFFYLFISFGAFAAAPTSVAQLALYQGPDREKILIEGAKRESQLSFYNSHTWFRTFVREFEKKYPFVKVAECATTQRISCAE
jgi:hypothetical protein